MYRQGFSGWLDEWQGANQQLLRVRTMQLQVLQRTRMEREKRRQAKAEQTAATTIQVPHPSRHNTAARPPNGHMQHVSETVALATH